MGTEAFDEELRRLAGDYGTAQPKGTFEVLDLMALKMGEGHEVDWLIEDIWPEGRHIHLHAQRKAGKSLVSLWMAVHLAIGKDPFTGGAITPRMVAYYDFEMTEDDVRERLEDMNIPFESLGNLHYYLHQPVPPLDTELGGRMLLEQTLALGEQVVFIDTMSRVVQGDENSSDTYINFYRFTGGPLKSAGIAMCRLDHEGHQEGRSRGSSAKADDVDIIWQLRVTDGGVELLRKASRVSWVPEKVSIQKDDDPRLAYSRVQGDWPAGTKEKAQELDAVDAPVDISRRKAAVLLKEGGYLAGKALVLGAALKYRKQRVIWP